jgi:hypothetical protein
VNSALDLYVAGRFEEAVEAYRDRLKTEPNEWSSMDGLASALRGAGRFQDAIPLMWEVHKRDLAQVPDSCGQLVNLACAYWCTEDRTYAMELAHGLVAGNLARKINMAPDSAGGCSFGLMLYYMAVSTRNETERDYAVAFLKGLKVKYDKSAHAYGFPKLCVQQLFGDASFEDALESATGERSVEAATESARPKRARVSDLSVVLFNDGSFRRGAGDEEGCARRMREVLNLGYWAEPTHWYLARHELATRAPA